MSNQYPRKQETAGRVKISEYVIRSIAQVTALEVEGVESLAEQKNLFIRPSNPVTISVSGDMVEITLKLVLKSGYRLPKVAEQVQMTVKENVQNMTGVVVSKVHVVAAGLAFDN